MKDYSTDSETKLKWEILIMSLIIWPWRCENSIYHWHSITWNKCRKNIPMTKFRSWFCIKHQKTQFLNHSEILKSAFTKALKYYQKISLKLYRALSLGQNNQVTYGFHQSRKEILLELSNWDELWKKTSTYFLELVHHHDHLYKLLRHGRKLPIKKKFGRFGKRWHK